MQNKNLKFKQLIFSSPIYGALFSALIVFLCAILLTPAKAQLLNETKMYIKKIQLKDISQLASLIKSSSIKAELKVEAINRIEYLARKNPEQVYKMGKKLIKDIRESLRGHQTDTQTNFNYKIRQAACDLLSAFNSKEIAPTSISEIRNLFLSDSSHKVQISCARALGDFKETPDLASKVLLEKLNSILEVAQKKDKSYYYDDGVKMLVIIRSIGNLASKSSFLTLMKVLQSGLSVPIKKEAEAAIEKIKW